LFLTRRKFSAALSTTALAAAAGLPPLGFIRSAVAQDVNPADLAKPAPLGDVVLGSANAPVTIVEYASMSCGHCAEFHKVTFPKIKSEYIDSDKVRFIFREYPLNLQAAAASMLTRCLGKDDPNRFHEIAGILFAAQDEWVTRDTAVQLRRIAKDAGMDDNAFTACLANQGTVDALQLGMEQASVKLKIDSTPTFFINGTRLKGAYPIEEFRKVIEANLKG
jgi:protein-disulfide isomerase